MGPPRIGARTESWQTSPLPVPLLIRMRPPPASLDTLLEQHTLGQDGVEASPPYEPIPGVDTQVVYAGDDALEMKVGPPDLGTIARTPLKAIVDLWSESAAHIWHWTPGNVRKQFLSWLEKQL